MPKLTLIKLAPGTVIGYWTILDGPCRGKYLCACLCGTERIVRASSLLKTGTHASRSCGCYHRQKVRATFTTHGGCRTSEYLAWGAMRERCSNPNHKEFHNYGGRGIHVCDEWQHSYSAFLKAIGPKPTRSHSLDRIDNDGHYELGNVRWATKDVQSQNRRLVKRYEHLGESLTLRQWSERAHIN